MYARQAPDGSIWLAVLAPDGNPALVPTGGEGWFVYGVLGYSADNAVPTIDQATFDQARKLGQGEWDAIARSYGGGGGLGAHYHGTAANTGPAVPT